MVAMWGESLAGLKNMGQGGGGNEHIIERAKGI